MSLIARDISGKPATTAGTVADSAPSYVRTALSAVVESDSSESFTELILPKDVQPRGTRSIESGLPGRTEAFEAGRKLGSAAFFNSPLMESLALELLMLRAAVEVLGRQVEHYKDLAETYAEYCQDYAELWEGRLSGPSAGGSSVEEGDPR